MVVPLHILHWWPGFRLSLPWGREEYPIEVAFSVQFSLKFGKMQDYYKDGTCLFHCINRALTRILKTGVPEPSLPKSGSPTIQKNIASFKKWESQLQKWEFRTANHQLVRALINMY